MSTTKTASDIPREVVAADIAGLNEFLRDHCHLTTLRVEATITAFDGSTVHVFRYVRDTRAQTSHETTPVPKSAL